MIYLLNTRILELELFEKAAEVPQYAILSHRWGDPSGEIAFEDIVHGCDNNTRGKKGYAKVQESCAQALRDGHNYIWIDSCCIDKRSSAHLSESINSMFKWYRQAIICYAYLEDISNEGSGREPWESSWFCRGWTLQELIAPPIVIFFNKAWSQIGNRDDTVAAQVIEKVTCIPQRILSRGEAKGCVHQGTTRVHFLREGKCTNCGYIDDLYRKLGQISVAQRMSWAAMRETTRVEDLAYCLLGLFDINMPLLYGEGLRSFRRLQEEILKTTADQSILAYEKDQSSNSPGATAHHLLATSPSCFANSNIAKPPLLEFSATLRSMRLSSTMLQIGMFVCPCFGPAGEPLPYVLGILDCHYDDDPLSRPAIILSTISPRGRQDKIFARVPDTQLIRLVTSNASGMQTTYSDQCE